jgi:hypothetical protein
LFAFALVLFEVVCNSNLLGIDVNSKFGKKKDVQTGSSYPSRPREFTSVYFGGVWVVYIVIFL